MNYFLTIPIAGVLGGALARAVGRARVPPRLAARRDLRVADACRHLHARLGGRAQRVGRRRSGDRDPGPDYPDVLGDFQDLVYRLGLAVAALAVVSAFLIQHSRFGWGLFSIRDEEGVAEELGVPDLPLQDARDHHLRRARRASPGAVATLQIGYLTPDGRVQPHRAAARDRDERPRRSPALAGPDHRRSDHLRAPGAAHQLGPRRVRSDRSRRHPRRDHPLRARGSLRAAAAAAPGGARRGRARRRDGGRGLRRLGYRDGLAQHRARGRDRRAARRPAERRRGRRGGRTPAPAEEAPAR